MPTYCRSMMGACLLLVGSVLPAFGESADLVSFLVAANNQNRQAIESATGTARLTYMKEVHPELIVNQRHKEMWQTGGTERQEIRWYVSGDLLRTDVRSLDLKEGEERWGVPQVEETVFTPERRMYLTHYSEDRCEAYINNPLPSPFHFVRNSAANFNPMLFFHVDDDTFEEWVKSQKEVGVPLQVSSEGSAGHEVFKVRGEIKEDSGKMWISEYELAADAGYNVTRARYYGTDGTTVMEFNASYTEGGTGGKCFFPQRYHMKLNCGEGTFQTVDVEFSGVRLNVPVDPKLFTMEGLLIPRGTRLIDMRYAEHIYSYYGGLPAKALDDLVATIKKEQWLTPAENDLPGGGAAKVAPDGKAAGGQAGPKSVAENPGTDENRGAASIAVQGSPESNAPRTTVWPLVGMAGLCLALLGLLAYFARQRLRRSQPGA